MVFSKGLFGCKLTRGVLKKSTGRPAFAVTFCSWKKRCSHERCTGGPTCQTDLVGVEGALAGTNGVARNASAPRGSCGAWMTNVFEEIYQKNVWGNSESHSGHGSSASATRFLRTALSQLLSDLGVKSMLDVPCGDFNWMRLLDLRIDYFGADIVPQLIEANQRKYSRPGRAFGLLDVVKDPLPNADLVFSRDLLVHLSEQDIRSALAEHLRAPAPRIWSPRRSRAETRTSTFRPGRGERSIFNVLHSPSLRRLR